MKVLVILVTPCAAALQAPPSVGFSRQEYWSGFPFPSPGHLPNPGIEPGSPALQAGSLPSEPPGKYLHRKLLQINNKIIKQLQKCTFLSKNKDVTLFPQVVKNSPANARDTRDMGSNPGSGGCPGEGNGHPLQYSCLGNPMDRGAWLSTVHGVLKS